jgi:hypothetical protein
MPPSQTAGFSAPGYNADPQTSGVIDPGYNLPL